MRPSIGEWIFGVAQIQLGRRDIGLRGRDIGFVVVGDLRGLNVEFFLRHDAVLAKRLHPAVLTFGERLIGKRLLHCGLRRVERQLIGRLFDHEQQVALFHIGAVLEQDLFQVALYLGSQLHGLCWHRRGDEFDRIVDRPLDGLGDRHLRRRRYDELIRLPTSDTRKPLRIIRQILRYCGIAMR